MRKYQQLALALVSAACTVAFLFYKHEYERLRHTLEYLDTFGEPPPSGGGGGRQQRPPCGYGTRRRASTPPAAWVEVTPDLHVYSSFWEGGRAQVRAIAALRRTAEAPEALGCSLWFESQGAPSPGSCSVEEAASFGRHGPPADGEGVALLYLLCGARGGGGVGAPYMVHFAVGSSGASEPLFVHESLAGPKGVADRFAVCVTPTEAPAAAPTLRLVEFVSYYNALGVDTFCAYGRVLTPLARKLLDEYGDEMGVEYEEKLFGHSGNLELSPAAAKRVVELDCLLRHRDTQEGVLVLDLDQYVVLEHGATLQETLLALGAPEVGEFHLASRTVCPDARHPKGGPLLLSQQVHSVGKVREMGVAVLRPRLLAASLGPGAGAPPKSQHVSAATAVVHRYSACPAEDDHDDGRHLPTSRRSVDKVEKSLLYRKWVINH